MDDAGCIYFVGYTDSDDFPTKNQFQNNQPAKDGFISKIDPNKIGAASLLYSSYIGGNGRDSASQIHLNSDGSVYVVGNTNSGNFPTLNQYQGDQPGYDVFVTRLDLTKSGSNQLLYSTYLGGSGDEGNADIVLDDSGKVYLVGSTNSADFPLLDEYQGYGGGGDIYVTLLNPANTGTSQLLYSTYLGGSFRENGTAIVLDSKGNAYVTGITSSWNFPIVYPYYQENLKSGDGTITKFSFNKPPVADAGADVSCVQKDTVTLDGSASYDPDGDPLTYSWMIEFKPNGSNAVLSDGNKVAPSLETDLPGDYVIKLVVNDGTIDSNPSFVTVTAESFEDALTEKINNLNTTIDSIPVSSFSNKQHKTNLIKFVDQAMVLITANTLLDYCNAKAKLTNAQRKVDGCDGGNVKDDWIVIPCPSKDKSDVYNLFQGAINLIDQITLEQWNSICP